MPSSEFVVIQFANDGILIPIAILLLDNNADRLYVRFRSDLSTIADPDDAEVVQLTLSELAARAEQTCGSEILEYLEDTLSNTLRLTGRTAVTGDFSNDLLDRLYAEHVARNTSGNRPK